MITVKTDAMKHALAQYVKDVAAATGLAMHDALAAAETSAVEAIKAQTKTRTGNLLNLTQVTQISDTQGIFRSSAPYAQYIDKGTPPHRITAVNARMLSFIWHGRRVFRFSVNHPGTAPRPFAALTAASGQMMLRDGLQGRVDALKLQ